MNFREKTIDLTNRFETGDMDAFTYNQELEKLARQSDAMIDSIKRDLKAFPESANGERGAKIAADAITFATFIKTLDRAKTHSDFDAMERLKNWNAREKASQSIGTDSLGGYTVPDELENTLVETIRRGGITEQRMREINMGSYTRNVPLEGSGVSVTWNDEGDAIEATSTTFDQSTLTAYRQDASVSVNRELLADSVIDVAGVLMDLFTAEVAQHFDRTVFTGDGSAPGNAAFSGVFTAAVAYSEIFSNSTFASITVSDLISAYHQVPSHLREEGVFVGHPDVVKHLKLETDSQNRYFWDPYAQASPRVHGRYPVLESDDAPNTDGASEEAMVFGNFKHLLLGRRARMETLVDPYTQAGNWRTRFLFVRRLALAYGKNTAFCRLLTAA